MKSLNNHSTWAGSFAVISLLSNGPGLGIMPALAFDQEGAVHDKAFGDNGNDRRGASSLLVNDRGSSFKGGRSGAGSGQGDGGLRQKWKRLLGLIGDGSAENNLSNGEGHGGSKKTLRSGQFSKNSLPEGFILEDGGFRDVAKDRIETGRNLEGNASKETGGRVAEEIGSGKLDDYEAKNLFDSNSSGADGKGGRVDPDGKEDSGGNIDKFKSTLHGAILSDNNGKDAMGMKDGRHLQGSCSNVRCGTSWSDAYNKCGTFCAEWPTPGWDACPSGENCYKDLQECCDEEASWDPRNSGFYLGCRADSEDRTLRFYLGVNYDFFSCSQACHQNGGRYFGLQYHGQCFCDTYLRAGEMVDESECNYRCAVNEEQFCGGHYRNSVYITVEKGSNNIPCTELEGTCVRPSCIPDEIRCTDRTGNLLQGVPSCDFCCTLTDLPGNTCGYAHNQGASTRFSYLGCYVDASTRDLPVEAPGGSQYTKQTCDEYCGSQGHIYFGLQWYGQCFCGDDPPQQEQVQDSECNTRCNNNSGQQCGGAWRNSVYRVRSTSSLAMTDVENAARNCRSDPIEFARVYAMYCRTNDCTAFAQELQNLCPTHGDKNDYHDRDGVIVYYGKYIEGGFLLQYSHISGIVVNLSAGEMRPFETACPGIGLTMQASSGAVAGIMLGTGSFDDFEGWVGSVGASTGVTIVQGAAVSWNHDFSVVTIEYSVGTGAGFSASASACYTEVDSEGSLFSNPTRTQGCTGLLCSLLK